MTIIDTTFVSALFALIAVAVAVGVVAAGYTLAKTYGPKVLVHVPRSAKPAMHGRLAH